MNCGVYLITNKSNNKVYVGKSIILKYRWKKHLWKLKQGKHYNLHLQSAFKKYGIDYFEFSILEKCSEDIVCEKEMFYISKYQSDNPQFGYNKTKGGEGLRATDEIKQKISNSLKGKPASESKKENCRKAQTGLKRSKEHRENIGKARRRPISQYDLKGNFIKNWDSIREAANELGFRESQIGRCVNGKRKTSCGFMWKLQNNPISYIEKPKKQNINRVRYNVLQISSDGKFIKEWESITKAAKETHTSKSSIIRCCKHKQKTANNLI
jgi:group I intron endonuclease